MSEDAENNESNIYVDQMGNVIITPAEETPQKIPDDIMESYKKEMRTDDYLDTNINLESMTKSEFNLLEIKKELTDIKQKEILSQYVVKPFDEMEEDKNEEKKQRDVEQIIKQWLSLQKTIKEEITLEDVIIHQQTSDTENLKDLFKSYYDLKLKKRKNVEDINELNMGNNDYLNLPSFYIQEEVEKKLKDACDPIKNLLFILRNNYDYLIKLISLIKPSDITENRKKVNSIVELFNNQFYENILLPNPEQQELLILIYKLFEEEISSMGAACPDDFLNNNSFLGIFLSSYTRREEIFGFISMILNPMLIYIDNDEKECRDLSVATIKRYIDRREKEKDKQSDKRRSSQNIKKYEDKFDYTRGPRALREFLLGKIPSTKIKFKNNFELEAEKEKEDDIKTTTFTSKDDNQLDENDQNIFQFRKYRRTITEKSHFYFNNKEIDYNKDYFSEINEQKLLEKIKKIEDGDLKEFYIKQLEQINNDPKKFSNEGILRILDSERKESLIQIYKESFLFIRQNIVYLLQKIVDKIITFPYPVRCICKIIYFIQ